MLFTIMTPFGTSSHTVSWLELNTPVGNFVIQPEHAPTFFLLAPGKPLTYCLPDGRAVTMMVAQGVVEVTRSTATLFSRQPL